jgi:hypothetical protein
MLWGIKTDRESPVNASFFFAGVCIAPLRESQSASRGACRPVARPAVNQRNF